MTLIKWKPTATSPVFGDFWNSFYKDLSNFAGNEGSFQLPAVNILDHNEHYELQVAAPGLKKEDFQLSIEQNVLTVSVNKEESKEETQGKYTRKEFSFQNFKRNFQLPEHIVLDEISAKYENGILLVSLPKKDEAKEKPVKQIEVK